MGEQLVTVTGEQGVTVILHYLVSGMGDDVPILGALVTLFDGKG